MEVRADVERAMQTCDGGGGAQPINRAHAAAGWATGRPRVPGVESWAELASREVALIQVSCGEGAGSVINIEVIVFHSAAFDRMPKKTGGVR